ncbi:L-lactate permease [Alloiococcus sp. CFN-8]|uniref:L-lactate permease n=1 Tax=Alloiococcus sp. CFN-8 TaxID=3416081 RepID=UPI003CEFEC42
MEILMFLLAMLPIIWLIIALGALKMPAFKACPIALIIAALLALIVWKLPVFHVATAALEGAIMALWPITIVIIAAVFTYNLCIHTGKIEIIKDMLTSVTKDKRILVLIIAWGFGGFLEGMAGFGTAVAIPASMLWGLGFNPILSVVVCLIANGSPTAFGSIGIPTITIANLTGLDSIRVAGSLALQLAPIVILTPFILVMLTGKSIKALKGVFLLTLISGLAFIIPEYLVATFIGAELPVVFGSVFSMISTIIFSRLLNKDTPKEYLIEEKKDAKKLTYSSGEAVRAWSPFILILVLLLITSKLVPSINNALGAVKSSVLIYQGKGGSPYTFSWLSIPGVMIFLAAFIGGTLQGASFKEMLKVLKNTMIQMWKTVFTIVTIIATAKIMGYSGMIAQIAAMFVAITGSYYPLVAPVIGSLGTFVTGSGTSSSVLFGGLQAETARTLSLSEPWLVASNVLGATAGKIISPQNIAIGIAATNQVGKESVIFRAVIKYYLLFVIIMGLTTFIGLMFL